MGESAENLVLGRSCGECNVCCDVLTINTPELKKLPGVLCPNCVSGQGCSIYESRPPVCRAWYCGWRMIDTLGDEWRPDRCGILVRLTEDDIPPKYQQFGLNFELLGGKVSQIMWAPFINEIASFIAAGVPVFLLVPGAPGYVAGKVFLNQSANLKRAVANHDTPGIVNELVGAADAAVNHHKEKVELD
jgi:hypothetical protein